MKEINWGAVSKSLKAAKLAGDSLDDWMRFYAPRYGITNRKLVEPGWQTLKSKED